MTEAQSVENQKTEWESHWLDEFLKERCGLANSQGGTLVVGRGNSGVVIGKDSAKEILEELPNSIRSALGIVPSIEMFNGGGSPYISVHIDPSNAPISFRGKLYHRSGAATHELRGADLNNFFSRRMGKTWDSFVVPKIKASDLDTDALSLFREKSIARWHPEADGLGAGFGPLLDSLSLVEGGKLARAAILLFHREPWKFAPGAFVRADYCKNDGGLIHQQEFRGPLIAMPDQIVESMSCKYINELIGPASSHVPATALQEALLNAIMHRDYTTDAPIQIVVSPGSLVIRNDGALPEKWADADLLSMHKSLPRNPKIAYAFYLAGYVETWGRGIERIAAACREANKRAPLFESSPNEMIVTLLTETLEEKGTAAATGSDGAGASQENGGGSPIIENSIGNSISGSARIAASLNPTQLKVLSVMRSKPNATIRAIAAEIGIAKRIVESHVRSLKKDGFLSRVGACRGGHWKVKAAGTD
jgi:ATP-dependent DNA helicase RecG